MDANPEATAKDALPAGTRLADYVIECVLAQGCFGITYLARQAATNAAVVIKEFFPAGAASRGDDLDMVIRGIDAETIADVLRNYEQSWAQPRRLDHPNILQVHEHLSLNGTGYLVFEFLKGDSFEAWLLAQPQRPDLATLKPLIDPILQAFAHLHEQGLVHGEITPSSIAIEPDGRPVLIDFGSLGHGGSSIAIWQYGAPEQRCADLRPARDIYGLGAILYRALAGRPPVDGQARVEACVLGEPDPLTPLSSLSAVGCSPAAATAIDAALALQIARRPASVADLRAGLGWA